MRNNLSFHRHGDGPDAWAGPRCPLDVLPFHVAMVNSNPKCSGLTFFPWRIHPVTFFWRRYLRTLVTFHQIVIDPTPGCNRALQ